MLSDDYAFIARAPHYYRRAERLLRRRLGAVVRVLCRSGIRADTVFDEQPHVDRLGLSEIERSLSVLSDDYAFHPSGATLSSRGTSIT